MDGYWERGLSPWDLAAGVVLVEQAGGVVCSYDGSPLELVSGRLIACGPQLQPLLVDGLAAEREQGITIDVAYRAFTTNMRKYIVADTPGHEQYTRNMATGASSAELAIIASVSFKALSLQHAGDEVDGFDGRSPDQFHQRLHVLVRHGREILADLLPHFDEARIAQRIGVAVGHLMQVRVIVGLAGPMQPGTRTHPLRLVGKNSSDGALMNGVVFHGQ